MNWLDYREALGIGFNDTEKTQYFLVKIYNALEYIKFDMISQINESEYYSFCNITGSEMRPGNLYGEGYNLILLVLKNKNKNIQEFISHYIALINCQKDRQSKKWKKSQFKNLICNLLDEARIPYNLLEDEDGVFLFPKGAGELDDALVSQPLMWLKDYPLAQATWIKALKDYSEATDLTASETADNFRKALERFFQEFFNSDKSLENLKSDYGEFLSSKGIPNEIKNNFEKLLEAYTKYNNNYAKHHDKTSKNVLEYIMYQTGNLIRLMITLK